MNPENERYTSQTARRRRRDYLRRCVVAMARRYFVEHGHEDLEDKNSYASLTIMPKLHHRDLPKATLEDIARTIKDLDDWKREFKLRDID